MAINGNWVAGGCSGSLLAPTLPVSAATNEGIRWQKKKKDDHRGGLGWLDVLLNREENRRVVAPFTRRKQQQSTSGEVFLLHFDGRNEEE